MRAFTRVFEAYFLRELILLLKCTLLDSISGADVVVLRFT